VVSERVFGAANRWVNPHSGQHKSGCFGAPHSGHSLLLTEILYVYPLLRVMRWTEDESNEPPAS
jgi:hypothetical protein